jgi:hypothetical protein
MSKNSMSLRITGDLPSADELAQRLGLATNSFVRRGTKAFGGTWVVPADCWTAILIEEWSGEVDEDVSTAMQQATASLERIAPLLIGLARAGCHSELYIISIRYEEDGGFELPAALVAAAAKAGLKLAVSIRCAIYDSAEDEDADVE